MEENTAGTGDRIADIEKLGARVPQEEARIQRGELDVKTDAELRDMAGEARSMLPDRDRGVASRFAEAADHARQMVERLSESPSNLSDAADELQATKLGVGHGISSLLLPESTDRAAFKGPREKISRVILQVIELLQALEPMLKQRPADVEGVRDIGASLWNAAQELAQEAVNLEHPGTTH